MFLLKNPQQKNKTTSLSTLIQMERSKNPRAEVTKNYLSLKKTTKAKVNMVKYHLKPQF